MFLTHIIQAIRAFLQHRRELDELSRLDSRQLADIGLTAGDLARYSNFDVWFPPRSRTVE